MLMPVHSRIGNALLGLIGVTYALAALSLLAYAVIQTWAAQSLLDYAVQVMLIVAAVVGVLFVVMARDNLGIHARSPLNARRHSQPNPEAAEARS